MPGRNNKFKFADHFNFLTYYFITRLNGTQSHKFQST
jgi:hypothetical protein